MCETKTVFRTVTCSTQFETHSEATFPETLSYSDCGVLSVLEHLVEFGRRRCALIRHCDAKQEKACAPSVADKDHFVKRRYRTARRSPQCAPRRVLCGLDPVKKALRTVANCESGVKNDGDMKATTKAKATRACLNNDFICVEKAHTTTLWSRPRFWFASISYSNAPHVYLLHNSARFSGPARTWLEMSDANASRETLTARRAHAKALAPNCICCDSPMASTSCPDGRELQDESE